jgi:hypothetical protein
MAYSLRSTLRNAILDAITTDVSTNGYLRIYSGTRPANVGTALSGNTLLAELRTNASAYAAAASGGVLTLNAITADSSADATGTATFARVFKSDGTTAVYDCSVGTSGTDIVFNTVSFVSGANVSISSYTITEGNA